MIKKTGIFLLALFLNLQNSIVFGKSISDFLGGQDGKIKYLLKSKETNASSSDLVLNIVGNVIDIILYFAGIIAVGVLIFGGFRYITTFGDEESEGNSKKIIINGIIGLFVVICSFILVENTDRFVRFLIT